MLYSHVGIVFSCRYLITHPDPKTHPDKVLMGILVVGLEGAKLRFQPPTTKSPVLTIVIYQVVARKEEAPFGAGLLLPSYYLINYIG